MLNIINQRRPFLRRKHRHIVGLGNRLATRSDTPKVTAPCLAFTARCSWVKLRAYDYAALKTWDTTQAVPSGAQRRRTMTAMTNTDTSYAAQEPTFPMSGYATLENGDAPTCAGEKDGGGNGNGGKEGGNGDDGGRTGLVTKTRPKTKKPALYKVLLLNDDYTPMEFVVLVLEKYFAKNREDAERVMLHVHQKGVGICGVYTFEIAETKVTQVMDFSRANNHPLQCTMEKE